ncbi:hypothetical protein PG999_001154 [Apiospora kogelbergensis]|uniref:Uncharacterized protein n=1 Tax=Apiospora kogelbergensis TaxID=1337665 RepID=A0AAW0RE00_9PEZI
MSSTPTPTIPAAAPMPRANSFAIRRRPVSTNTSSVRKPVATHQPTSPLTPPPSATVVTAEGGGIGAVSAHNGNNIPVAYISTNNNHIATPPMSPGTQQSGNSSNAAPVPFTPLSPQPLNGASMRFPLPPPPPLPAQASSPGPVTLSQPSSERPGQQQQQQQQQHITMHFPPPPGQNGEQNQLSPDGSSSPSSPITTPSSSMIPPYNPAYATTQLPHSHLQPQRQNNGGGYKNNTAMPSLGPTATPSFGLSMNGPTIPLVNNHSRRPESLRRVSRYVNKESAKKAYKSSVDFLAKTGKQLDKYAQPAMPFLAATNPDIAAAYSLHQALRPGLQQQQQGGSATLPGGANAAASSSGGSGTGLAVAGGLAAAGLADYALFQGLGGDGGFTGLTDSNSGFDASSLLASFAQQQQTTADGSTASLLESLQNSGQAQPDLSALFQGATGDQQQNLLSAILQQQQQQSSDTAESLLASLGGGSGAQGSVQTDPSQQMMDYIQQQSAASTQTLLSAMQNNASTQGNPQDFASQMLSALSQQQQQQQPDLTSQLMSAIQQQQAATNQALQSAMQGGPTATGQDYGQILASILQQQQQQQQAFMSTFQQQQQQAQAQSQQPAQQTNTTASEAQQQTSFSSQEQATYEEQLLNAALQQQQQQQPQPQYGASGFANTPSSTQQSEPAPAHTSSSMPATDTTGASQSSYSPEFYHSPSGPAAPPSQSQQTNASNQNLYTGPANSNNNTHPSVVSQQPHHHQFQAQSYNQQGLYAPNPSAPPASNTVTTPSPPPQQQNPTSGQSASQGWPSHTQVELSLNLQNTQHFAPPPQQHQQTQQHGSNQGGEVAQPPDSLPPAHQQQHAADLSSANTPPLTEVTSQQHQQHIQYDIPHGMPSQAAHPSSVAVNGHNLEATAIHQPLSQPTEFHSQLSPEFNISPNINLDFNMSQPPPLMPLDPTAASPLSSSLPELPCADQQPPPASSPRPPLPVEAATTTPAWTQHHLPTFGLESLLLPPEATLEAARPNILIGDLDPQSGTSMEIRLLYDTAQIQHEIESLRSTISTENFVVIEPYHSFSLPNSVPTISSNLILTETTTTTITTPKTEKVKVEVVEVEISTGAGTEAVSTSTINVGDDKGNESSVKDDVAMNADVKGQPQTHALTLAATAPDPDGDTMALHKLIIAAPSSFAHDHGLVFSFYAPLLPSLGLGPLKQTVEAVLESIVWADRNASCRVVSERLIGTWVLRTPLNPSSSLTAIGKVEKGDGAGEVAVAAAAMLSPELAPGSVIVEDEAIDVSEEAWAPQYETRTLRFLEGGGYSYDRDIVSENVATASIAHHGEYPSEEDGKEPSLGKKMACYNPDHTRGRFKTYEYPDGAMHLVLVEDGTGSVEVQVIGLTGKAMDVRGRVYVKTT